MTIKILGGGSIDGQLGRNPDWPNIRAKLNKQLWSVDDEGFLQAWIVEEAQSDGGQLLENGYYANPANVRGESDGINPVGKFSDTGGVTFNYPNDAAQDGDGNWWVWTGSLPYTAAQGTVPTEGDYAQVFYNDASQVATKTTESAQDFIDSFALKIFQSPTDGGLTEIQTRTVNANEVYEVRKTSDNSLATIYSDAAGTTEIVQNGTDNKSGSDGVVEFFVADGDYYVEVDSAKGGLVVSKLKPFLAVADMTNASYLSKYAEGTRIEWQGYYSQSDGGGNWGVLKFGAHTGDGGSIFSIDANTYVEANLKGEQVNVLKFGAVGDGVFDNRLAFQAAVNSIIYGTIFIPSGVYARSGRVNLKSNITLQGEGGTVITNYDAVRDSWFVVGGGNEGSSNPDDNFKNIAVRDIEFRGNSSSLGVSPFDYMLAFSAVTDVEISGCRFIDFRGDAIHLASGFTLGISRRNIGINIYKCFFDGLEESSQRNGVSIISGENVNIDKCFFYNIGSTTPSTSVGAIDFEPNDNNSFYSNVNITNCTFEGINNVNTAAITTFLNSEVTGFNKGVKVENCSFIDCFWGVATNRSVSRRSARDESDNITIRSCTFLIKDRNDEQIPYSLRLFTPVGVTIDDCDFLREDGSTQIGGDIILGTTNRSACNITVENCRFKDIKPQNGLLSLYSVDGLRVSNNTFTDIEARIVFILADSASGVGRVLRGISVTNNNVFNKDKLKGGVNTLGLMCFTQNTLNFINTTCNIELNNMYDGVPEFQFNNTMLGNRSTSSLDVSSGHWSEGDFLRYGLASPTIEKRLCTTSGSFGEITGVSGDAEVGSRVVINVINIDNLREGFHVTVGDAITVYKILLIEGDAIYLSSVYTGSVTAGAEINLKPPVFNDI